jgi:hypothetical protein
MALAYCILRIKKMERRKVVENIKTLRYGWRGPFHTKAEPWKVNYCHFKAAISKEAQKQGIPLDDLTLEFVPSDYRLSYLDITAYRERDETDEELNKRRDEKEQQELVDRQYRREQYAKLKKEFE